MTFYAPNDNFSIFYPRDFFCMPNSNRNMAKQAKNDLYFNRQHLNDFLPLPTSPYPVDKVHAPPLTLGPTKVKSWIRQLLYFNLKALNFNLKE